MIAKAFGLLLFSLGIMCIGYPTIGWISYTPHGFAFIAMASMLTLVSFAAALACFAIAYALFTDQI